MMSKPRCHKSTALQKGQQDVPLQRLEKGNCCHRLMDNEYCTVELTNKSSNTKAVQGTLHLTAENEGNVEAGK